MYRHVPVVEYAKELIASRELGDITQYRGFFLADYAADPKGILTWRYKPNDAGLGVLGDSMTHAVDIVQNLLGSIESASAKKESSPGAPGGAGGHGDGPLRCRGRGEGIRRERRLRGLPRPLRKRRAGRWKTAAPVSGRTSGTASRTSAPAAPSPETSSTRTSSSCIASTIRATGATAPYSPRRACTSDAEGEMEDHRGLTLLGVDIGTTHVKACAYDEAGRFLGASHRCTLLRDGFGEAGPSTTPTR
jgi:hypothetical protein